MKSILYSFVLTKTHAWAPYCSAWQRKPSAKIFAQGAENMYADNLVNTCESLEELQKNLMLLTSSMKGKGLWVSMGKIISTNIDWNYKIIWMSRQVWWHYTNILYTE